MIDWTLVLMCVLGGISVSVAFLTVSFITANSYRDRSVFWNVFTAASSSGGVATFLLVVVRPCVKGDGEVMAVTIYVFGGEGERSLGRFFEGLAVAMLLICIMELK